MEKAEVKLFVVLEEHMLERYLYIIKKNGFKSYCLTNFNNIQIGTSFRSIVNRIKNRKIVKTEYIKLKHWIEDHLERFNVTQLYFSNSEGYIAHNVILKVRKDFPEIKLIGLQHGIFELARPPKKKFRNIVNNICYFALGFYPIGVGFGEKIVDTYIVYNDRYMTFLVEEFGWSKENVIVDLQFLKAELFDKKEDRPKKGKVALFLMQCLSLASMCSKQEETYLNDKVINHLIENYEKVIIKNHPACLEAYKTYSNLKVEFVDDLINAFNMSTHAFSYSSTTLIEAEIFDLEAYAINSKLVKEDKSIYKLFDNVIDFENEIDI